MNRERARLYNEAATAFQRGDYRKSADTYRKAYEVEKQNGRTFGQLDYMSFHGYTSLLRYEQIPVPSQEDFDFLKAVGTNPNASALVRTMANFTIGFLRRNQGDRERAARYYRKAIAAADGASAAERERKELGEDGTLKTVGPLIDFVRLEAETNIGYLEGTIRHIPSDPHTKAHRIDVPIGPGGSDADREAARQLLDKLSVGGGACDQCGRRPAPSEPKLLVCSGCSAAWYCDRTCQAAARPKHKAACGPLKPGMRVMLKSLEKQPQLNGTVVQLVGFAEDTGRWQVSIIGGDRVLSIKEQNLQRLRTAQ